MSGALPVVASVLGGASRQAEPVTWGGGGACSGGVAGGGGDAEHPTMNIRSGTGAYFHTYREAIFCAE